MMTQIWKAIASLALTAALLVAGWGAWRSLQLVRLQEEAAAAALHADSVVAVRDTTRVVSSPDSALLQEWVRMYQRRIVQTRQVADSLDRALRVERASRYVMEAFVHAYQEQLRAKVLGDGGNAAVRRAEFTVREAPYTIAASVALPSPPDSGTLSVHVSLDSAAFEARVGCGAPGAAGVRPATLTFAGPSWMQVRLSKLEQEPRVCGTVQASRVETSWRRAALSRFGVTVGYAAMPSNGRVQAGPAVLAGIRVWP